MNHRLKSVPSAAHLYLWCCATALPFTPAHTNQLWSPPLFKVTATAVCLLHCNQYLLTDISEVPPTEALSDCCYLLPLLLCQLVCILLQDGCSAGFVRQAEVDGKVKPAQRNPQQSIAQHSLNGLHHVCPPSSSLVPQAPRSSGSHPACVKCSMILKDQKPCSCCRPGQSVLGG